MNPYTDIEEDCQKLAEYRAKLRRKLELKKKAQDAIDAEHNAGLREIQDQCNVARAGILEKLEVCRDAFKSPKTREFFGIKVGFQKQQDTVECPEDAVLIDRIEKMLPAQQAKGVLDRSVTIIKSAFKKLPWEALQKLGCSRIVNGDKPVIHTGDDDIEKLATATLGDGAAAVPAVS